MTFGNGSMQSFGYDAASRLSTLTNNLGGSSSTRRFLMADERGSIISITDSSGATININAYDEFGIPASSNEGRFGYTGQITPRRTGAQMT